ncbi:MAG: serine/threonine-protein kinase [Acidobacteria bacterium]|nr:serine/threonine-protein kinase [Acidobacteriota bacterium]
MEDPSTIGRYEIAERVGRGGMGVLYRGRDPVLDRDVAVKVMTTDLSDDSNARAYFFKEAKAAARLQHRNIVTIYEFGESDGNPFIAMEFLRGQNLATRLRSDPPLTIDATTDIIVQLCTGLHHAHSSGVIHRDVKPANVWIQPDGAVKLLDFGIARVSASTMTQGKDTLGSVAYMAPERFGNGPVDSRADIFAVGVILYELLAGRRPFDGETPTAIVSKILQEAPPPLSTIAPSVPPALLAVVDRALQKDQDARYQTALELATDVRLAGVESRVIADSPDVRETRLTGTILREPVSDRPRRAGATGAVPAFWEALQDQLNRVGVRRIALAAIALLAVAVVGSLWLGTGRRADIDAPVKASSVAAREAGPSKEPGGGSLRQLPSTVTLRVESEPLGAAISLNGAQLANTTPVELTVERGSAAKIRFTKSGFTPIDVPVTAEVLAAGRVAVKLSALSRDPVTVVADGPYPFEIVEGGRVISEASTHHEVRVYGRTTVRLRAAEYLLDQSRVIDPAVGRRVTVEAPALGILAPQLQGAFEACQARIGRKDLGGFPLSSHSLVQGNYIVTVECPNRPGRPFPVLIRPGETTPLIIR